MVVETGRGAELAGTEVDLFLRAGRDKDSRGFMRGSKLDGGYSDAGSAGVNKDLDFGINSID